jgi:hypothetical protein
VGCRLSCFRSAVTKLHTCTHYLTLALKCKLIESSLNLTFQILRLLEVGWYAFSPGHTPAFTHVLRQRHTVDPSFRCAPDTNDWIRLVLPQRLPLVSLKNQVISTLPLAKGLSNQCVVTYIIADFAVVHACNQYKHQLLYPDCFCMAQLLAEPHVVSNTDTGPHTLELCFCTAKSCANTTTHRSLIRIDMDLRLV